MLTHWRRSVLTALLLAVVPVMSMAQVGVEISVNVPPPELPVYEQPPIPAEGYLWTPGYWAWSDDDQDYYWVPGTWILAPQPGYLWTPGYWGNRGSVFIWNVGYWGPQVGFYGGVNYGHGYGGRGYEGGYWQGDRLYYNRSVTNISNTNITNVYNKTVINNVTVNRVSYNGGTGGVRAQPTAAETAAAHERHLPALPAQEQHVQAARSNPALRTSVNHGVPPVAATPRPGAFSGADVVPAKHPGTMSVVPMSPPAEHPAQPRPGSQPQQPQLRQPQEQQPQHQPPQQPQQRQPQEQQPQHQQPQQPQQRQPQEQQPQHQQPQQPQQRQPQEQQHQPPEHAPEHPPEH